MGFLLHALLLLFAVRLLDEAWDEMELTNSQRIELMKETLEEEWDRAKKLVARVRNGNVTSDLKDLLERIRQDEKPESGGEEVERLG